MLKIKKAITVSKILLKNLILVILSPSLRSRVNFAKDLSVTCLKRFFATLRMTDNGKFVFNNLVSLSLILALFCLSGYLYAQMPPALDFPPGRELGPRHPFDLKEISGQAAGATAISENVELVGATGGAVYAVFVQENYAYICAGGTLIILDVSAPSNPTKVGYVTLPDIAYGVYVQGGLAYVTDGSSGLRIIDVSSPSSPREVGFFDTPGHAEGVYVQGSLTYVADYLSGLRIIDVSSPSSPREVGFLDTPGYAYGVYVQGSLAYVADGSSGLRIIDVSSPSSPVEVGFLDTPYAFGVYVQGGLAYVADFYSGLRIIDVSSPSSPKEVGFYDTPGYAEDVYVQGGLAYVADSLGGLIILRYTGGEPVYYGDVSGNGEITAFDVSLILRVVVGILQLNDPNYPNLTLDRADVSGNGTVSALDAALVLQYTVGLITQFPCQRPAGAPALDAEVEFKLLTKAIGKLEAVPLDQEGQQVLESLKRVLAEQNHAADAVGLSTALLQNFPNPFNPETWIPYELAQDANVTIRIYNAKGQLIRTFSVGEQKAGLYVSKDKATYWDGRDNFGEKVASGVYFYTLQVEPQSRRLPDKLHPNENKVGSFRMTRKMVILK